MNLFSLEGKIAFVTGAGSGIGQRIAVGLAEAGASVGCFDLASSSSGLNETVTRESKALASRGLSPHWGRDEARQVSPRRFPTLEKELGPLSVAANCAGVANAAPAEEMPLAQWQRGLRYQYAPVSFSPVRQKPGHAAAQSKVRSSISLRCPARS